MPSEPSPITKKARIEAVKVLISEGWSPPVPNEIVAHRILDDIINANPRVKLKLTGYELRAIRYAAEGYTEREAAEIVGIEYYTFRRQSKMARRKLGAKSQAHAVAICFREGLL